MTVHLARAFVPTLCCLAALAACSPTILTESPQVAPPLPERTVPGAARYEVVAAETTIYARVFRSGRLEKLGHSHVVVFDDVRGSISLADPIRDSLFDLAVSTVRVRVDPPELRRRQNGAGFETAVSEQARERTRGNLQGEAVLDAAAYPYVMISSTMVEGPVDTARVTLAVTIKDVTREVVAPVALEIAGGRLEAEGELELLQTDFGIQPFSALGGALKVEDRVELVFEIVAEER